MKFEGKVIVVTGGARDIGRAVSKRLASEGAALAINYFGSDDQAASLRTELASMGTSAFVLKGDMTKEKDVETLINKAVNELGDRVDGLVNIAGGLIERRPIDKMDEAFFNKVIRLNLNPTFLTTKAVISLMSDQAAIVNLASQAGRDGGGPGASAYATSKGAIMTFTRSMAKELGPRGIRVNALCPGMINTSFHDTFTDAKVRVNVASATPLRREGSSNEVAGAVSFLLSDESSFLNGVNVDINGGLMFS